MINKVQVHLILGYDELHVRDVIYAYTEFLSLSRDAHSPILLLPFFVVEYENIVLRSHIQALPQLSRLEFAFEEIGVAGTDLSVHKNGRE